MIGDRNTNDSFLRRPGLAVRAVLVLAAGIALAVPIARADAQNAGELDSKLSAAREEAKRLGGAIEDKILALAAARQRAGAAQAQEDELSATLAEGRERSARLAERLDAAREELDATRDRLERALDALAHRLVAIYKSGEISDVDVLLDSQGYEDLATRADLLGRIQEADRALAQRIDALRAELADRVAAVDRAKERSDALNARVEAARAEIAAVRAEAQARAAALSRARAAQAQALDSLQTRMSGWRDRLAKLEQISQADAASEVAGWANDGDWAIPEAIVMCESGGNYSALNPSSGAGGAYQILPSTWKLYGGKGLPHQASPAEQDRIAALIWADSGPGAWVCAG